MIDVCFWCMRAKKSGDGKPEHFNYDPCAECAEWWSKGVLVIQVTDNDLGNPAIIDGVYPTGKWVVISEENVKNVLTDYPSIDKIIDTKTMYVNVNDWVKLIQCERTCHG